MEAELTTWNQPQGERLLNNYAGQEPFQTSNEIISGEQAENVNQRREDAATTRNEYEVAPVQDEVPKELEKACSDIEGLKPFSSYYTFHPDDLNFERGKGQNLKDTPEELRRKRELEFHMKALSEEEQENAKRGLTLAGTPFRQDHT